MKYLTNNFYAAFKIPESNIIPTESLIDRYGRAIAMRLACNAGNEDCLTDTFNQVRLFANDMGPLTKGLEATLLCSGLRGVGKQDEWVKLWKKMQASSDTTFRGQIITGLGCTDDARLLKDYLESLLGQTSEASYTQAERRSVFTGILSSYSGIEALLNVMKDFEALTLSRLGYTDLQTLVTQLANTIKNTEQQALLLSYLDSYTTLTDTAKTAIQTVVTNNLATQQNEKYTTIMNSITRLVNNFERSDVESQLILPKTSAPTYYRIHLDASNIHTGDTAFSGEVTIDVTIKQLTSYIMFHSKTQVIQDLHVYENDGTTAIPIIEFSLFVDTDTLTIYFENELQVDQQIKVHIKYTTDLLTYMAGFYRTSYVSNGQTIYLAATQFQAANARFAFPCYGN